LIAIVRLLTAKRTRGGECTQTTDSRLAQEIQRSQKAQGRLVVGNSTFSVFYVS